MKMSHLILLILLFSLAAQEPKSKEKDIFSQVPTETRGQMQKRLRLYIKYTRQQEYGKLYEMFSKETKHPRYAEAIGNVYPTKTKDTYVQYYKSHYPKVLNFKPQSLKESHFGDYKIRGEATLLDTDGNKSKEERVLFVWLENGDWYFSEFNEEITERFVNEPIKVAPPKIIESLPPY